MLGDLRGRLIGYPWCMGVLHHHYRIPFLLIITVNIKLILLRNCKWIFVNLLFFGNKCFNSTGNRNSLLHVYSIWNTTLRLPSKRLAPLGIIREPNWGPPETPQTSQQYHTEGFKGYAWGSVHSRRANTGLETPRDARYTNSDGILHFEKCSTKKKTRPN